MNLDNEIKIRYEHFLNFVPKVMEFLTITQEEADLDIVYKGEIDLVTKADKGSEERIIREIEKTFPLDSILGEEGTDKKGSSIFKWIIDPLDGTINYSHRLPLYCACIGLENQESKEIVMGIVPFPAMNEIYHARKGQGAFKNRKQISVSKTKDLKQSLLCTGFPYDREKKIDRLTFFHRNFLLKARGVRRIGAAGLDLCWVAEGRFDAFWEEGLKPWDMAAPSVILAEAGGRMSTYDGNAFSPYIPNLIASNGFLHEKMVERMGDYLHDLS
ncbi:inositol monophosphatase family protein [Leptospira santarosai]|uniref:Inositol-1-monophosphatase n=1 Tax=Leptospira santarosai serovar Arenal str. MAVJ 401 TaxID=1049976 RepID=M6JVW2_9LEPT|nr:inositol monophosphatase family protein [Leptospira santarosai]EMM75217.1 inositol monophosphatase family protein [Leptospira santarosai str. 2000030832]EMN19612.1 inositol monophosphatase family protein [Leptospira santarosai serovar Arenal str. MAVJ 401]MDI7205365.1 inositol monophosphatase family protein [Leptospira santarosai]MDI7212455.1 inositol monophosphatase family protein [Leptospira santarosai]MDI7224109.1 inositol monophosphatase family protein [Leptospira santarosai]